MPVGDAQHFRAVGIVAAAFAPQIRQLQCRHQQLRWRRRGSVPRARSARFFSAPANPAAARHRCRPPPAGSCPRAASGDATTISASLGFSFRIGRKNRDNRMGKPNGIGGTREASSESGSAAKTQGREPRKPFGLQISGRFAGNIDRAIKARARHDGGSSRDLACFLTCRHVEVAFQCDLLEVGHQGLDAHMPAAGIPKRHIAPVPGATPSPAAASGRRSRIRPRHREGTPPAASALRRRCGGMTARRQRQANACQLQAARAQPERRGARPIGRRCLRPSPRLRSIARDPGWSPKRPSRAAVSPGRWGQTHRPGLTAFQDRQPHIFCPGFIFIFMSMPPAAAPGPCEPTPSTSNETFTLPAFSNSSVTGTLSPCLSGLFRSNIIK